MNPFSFFAHFCFPDVKITKNENLNNHYDPSDSVILLYEKRLN